MKVYVVVESSHNGLIVESVHATRESADYECDVLNAKAESRF